MFGYPVEIQGKIICSKFKGVFDHSFVGFNGKQVLEVLFFNILRSIGVLGEGGFNRLVGKDQSIRIIRGC